ncbi:MAG TPA: hypothetical protein VF904_03140 [Anaeromyxobacteraceae bacterium]
MKTLLGAALALVPAAAGACPVCARDGTPHAALFIGAMILAPYAVAGLVVLAVRRGSERSDP